MIKLNRRALIAGLLSLPVARAAKAGTVPYVLAPDGTSVGFTFDLSGVAQSGTMPIQSAEIHINPNRLQDSSVTVVLNVANARTKLPFARGPMLSESVLDADAHPTIRFASTGIQLGAGGRISDGARIIGDLTVRGITRPVTLQANLFRRPGSAADDLSSLSIQLIGALNRHAFGASGYPDLVDDLVGLNIHAEIIRDG